MYVNAHMQCSMDYVHRTLQKQGTLLIMYIAVL